MGDRVKRNGLLHAFAALFFLGSLCVTHPVQGAEVSGVQTGKWTLAASPYIVAGDVIVPAGQALAIEPGVIVKFRSGTSLRVEGNIDARGTASNFVIFTSVNDKEFGLTSQQINAEPTNADWLGIAFIGSGAGNSVIENVIIRYSSNPLAVRDANPRLEKVLILDCAASSVSINGQQVPVRNNQQSNYSAAQTANPSAAPKPARTSPSQNPVTVEQENRRQNPVATKQQDTGTKDNSASGTGGGQRNLVTAFTMSQVSEILKNVANQVALRADPDLSEKFNLFDQNYLVNLTNHLDLNYIGVGRPVAMNPEAIIAFVLEKLEQGMSPNTIGLEMVAEFERTGYRTASPVSSSAATSLAESASAPDMNIGLDTQIGKINVGGFIAGEIEYHQEPDGMFHTLFELNQARIYFSTEINPFDLANNISVLAEFNPVPEEVIHQIESIALPTANGTEVLSLANAHAGESAHAEEEEIIPFEQLYFRINNVGNSGFNLTIGQFRLPFGLWSDYTSHRNFTSAKNNMLVNGFALKKIELGVMLERALNEKVDVRVALVHGRQSRTSDLSREDIDNKKDLVGRIGLNAGRLRFGASAYFAEFSLDRNIALGLDWLYSINRLSVGGELVYQKNNNVNKTFGTNFDFMQVSATSGYVQFDYALRTRLHVYGMYEFWRYSANSQQINNPAYKAFHGLRYQLHPQLRWTLIEYGRMFHEGFDEGNVHLSTQIEVIF